MESEVIRRYAHGKGITEEEARETIRRLLETPEALERIPDFTTSGERPIEEDFIRYLREKTKDLELNLD